MSRQVALLRAINLGARNRVAMADLRALMEELGFRDVATYLQSGNVLFDGRRVSPGKLASALEERFGFAIPVVLRTHDDLADLAAARPLSDVATDNTHLQVLFGSEEVGAERVARLDPDAFAPEAFALRAREVVVWSPEGSRGSPLLRALERSLTGLTVTARNWRTVEALATRSAD